MIRLAGALVKIDDKPLTAEQVGQIAKDLLGPEHWRMYVEQKDLDAAVQVPDLGRYRMNCFFQRGVSGIVMRKVKTHIPTIEELRLPLTLKNIALSPRGLIIVSGPTGCGKSSTLAAMIDWINAQRSVNILTAEDPIEYMHDDKKGIVNQREIGTDTKDYDTALRYCLRQDADVIMIGEMRDEVSMMAAMRAAEVGRLVLTTLHATDAAGIVPRIIDMFGQNYQDQVRVQLASVLTAGICQRLVPTNDPKAPVAPAVEILFGASHVKQLIRENKLYKLYAAIETGAEFGMCTLNQSLLEMVQKGLITAEQAMNHSLHPESLKLNLQGIILDESKRILQGD